MAKFQYEVLDASGKKKKGTIEADNISLAGRKLKNQGFMVLNIKEENIFNKDIEIPGFKKKITDRDLSVFCRQFSSILKAGVSIINALQMLSEQTENSRLKKAIEQTASSVEKGETLSESMRKCDDVFPNLLISMVAAGEASGSLETSIERMASQFEKDAKLKGIVKKAMIYPIVLLCVAIGVVVVMMVVVVPNFMTMFEDLDTELPLATRIVVAISDFVTGKWYILVAVIAAIIVGRKMYLGTDEGRRKHDQFQLKAPIIGKLKTKTACAEFSRTLGTLLRAGMPVIQALEITAGTMSNVILKQAVLKIRSGVSLGLPMSQQIKAAGVFPPMVYHMVGIGEETGSTEEMLDNVAIYYDEEVQVATEQATALMEPIIILVMALLVGGIIAAVYGPMITLYNTLG